MKTLRGLCGLAFPPAIASGVGERVLAIELKSLMAGHLPFQSATALLIHPLTPEPAVCVLSAYAIEAEEDA
jgi:hypothetical protein